jgi:branched-chain amino acid transport system substrate-binding protein
MLLQSIQNAGVDDPAVAKDEMAALEYEAISGLITFDEFHNPTKSAAILHVKDGQILFEASVSP